MDLASAVLVPSALIGGVAGFAVALTLLGFLFFVIAYSGPFYTVPKLAVNGLSRVAIKRL